MKFDIKKMSAKIIAVLVSTGFLFSNTGIKASLSGKFCALIDAGGAVVSGLLGFVIFDWGLGNKSADPDLQTAITGASIMTGCPAMFLYKANKMRKLDNYHDEQEKIKDDKIKQEQMMKTVPLNRALIGPLYQPNVEYIS